MSKQLDTHLGRPQLNQVQALLRVSNLYLRLNKKFVKLNTAHSLFPYQFPPLEFEPSILHTQSFSLTFSLSDAFIRSATLLLFKIVKNVIAIVTSLNKFDLTILTSLKLVQISLGAL